MAAPKGHVKYGGRTAGVPNKKTLEWEEFGKKLLEVGLPRAMTIMETCEDEEFMDNFQRLLEYFKPKLARNELTNAGEKFEPGVIILPSRND